MVDEKEPLKVTQVNEEPKQEQVDAIFGLTIPPVGVKFVGTAFRLDINGSVMALESESLQQNTVWKTNSDKLIAAANILMRANTVNELKAHIHKRIDMVFEAWSIKNKVMPAIAGMKVVNPESESMPELPIEPVINEQQPTNEALKDIASNKTNTLEVESKLNPSRPELL